MKKEDLFDAVTEIDDRHIDHAARHSFRRSFAWKQLGALAACGVLLIGLARFAGHPAGKRFTAVKEKIEIFFVVQHLDKGQDFGFV